MRSTVSDAAHRAQTQNSRACIREIDDDHLLQEIKTADVMNSEVATGFECTQPIGMTCVAMPQDKETQQQPQQGQQGGQDGGGNGGVQPDWNKNQPKGPCSEGVVSYGNGSRSHPVMTSLDDRRVRPYGQKPGEGQFYDPAGSGQTIYHRNRDDGADGLYLVSLDDQQQSGERGLEWRDGQQPKSRALRMRHANKKRQRRKKQQQQGGQHDASGGGQQGGSLPDDSKSGYKHEGDSINTEVELNKSHINFNDGGGNKGYYDNGAKDWCHMPDGSKERSMRADKKHTHIKNDGGHVWVQGATFKSMPFVVKPDPCS